MQFMECPINTYCMGLAASGAAILLAAGTKGKRFALPNSKVMCHQPYGQVGGQVSDIEIQANEILKEHERLNQILAKHTGQPIDVIAKETDRDRYFSAEEAKEFGLVDEVLTAAGREVRRSNGRRRSRRSRPKRPGQRPDSVRPHRRGPGAAAPDSSALTTRRPAAR